MRSLSISSGRPRILLSQFLSIDFALCSISTILAKLAIKPCIKKSTQYINFKGCYPTKNCYSRVLSRVALDVLQAIRETVSKVPAYELKEVSACLDTQCPDFIMTLTLDDGKKIEILGTYLKHLYDATYLLTTRPYPTANLFLAEVSKLLMKLAIAAFSQDLFLSSLILPLLKNFDHLDRMLSRG
ncbi:unnamed protein product [Vicia faba]|uniref:Uncharacterized protein n=1 Tax=Vicia faba TaxID=3906 RepID=A0AAV1B6L3_VICFA|nr:unnamed protein product [Vicia faba]